MIWAGTAAYPAVAQETVPDGPRLELTEDEPFVIPVAELTADLDLDSVRVVLGEGIIGEAVLDGGELRIRPAPDSAGSFALRIYSSPADTIRVAELDGVVSPRTDLRAGVLQSSESHEGRPGIVRIYTTARELLAEVRAGESGRFPAAQLPRDRDEYVVQAVITRDGEPFGFVRTLNVQVPGIGEDLEIPRLRTVPFDGLAEIGMDSLAFREHVLLVTRGLINRWDLEAMNGVFILERSRRGWFSEREVQLIGSLFADAAGVPAFVRERAFDVYESRGSNRTPYGYTAEGIEPAAGWIVVAPDTMNDVSSWSRVDDLDGDGIYDRGLIAIHPKRAARLGKMDRLVIYEAGRILGMAAGSDPLFFPYTMMVPGAGPQVPDRPTVIDEKTGAILYEPSFSVLLDVEGLLGLQFDLPAVDLTVSTD